MAGMLPDFQYMNAAPSIQSFRAGGADAQESADRNLLKTVGEVSASQGLDAGAKVAMAGGDVKTGISMQNLSIERQAQLYDFMGRAAGAADTPQKWTQLVQTFSRTFGPDSVKGFEDFRSRDSAIMLSMTAAQQATLRIQQQAAARAERALQLQEKAAVEKPTYMTREGPTGTKDIVRIEPSGRSTIVNPEGVSNESANPFMTGGAMNESQSKDALYSQRMIDAEQTLRDPKVVEAATSSKQRATSALADKVPFGLARGVVSNEFQKFDQAQRNFINATLRRESGAVISDAEFENARRQYFPEPGDTPDRLAQKQKNRQTAIEGIGAGAGKGFSPTHSFDDKGNIVPRKPKQEAAKPTAGDPLSAARDAIKKGAPREAVIKRLRDNGIDPAGL